jgi:hypothetical protein
MGRLSARYARLLMGMAPGFPDESTSSERRIAGAAPGR